jgi:hypothetical protein
MFLHKLSSRNPHKITIGVEVGRIWWPQLRIAGMSSDAVVKMLIEAERGHPRVREVAGNLLAGPPYDIHMPLYQRAKTEQLILLLKQSTILCIFAPTIMFSRAPSCHA